MEEKGLQVFSFQDKQVRVVMENGEPWWVAKDICGVLELGNVSQAVERLDNDEKGICKVDTPGGMQDMTVINESGIYALILRSNKPEAEKFRKWITSEVLPAIRKRGAYMTPQKIKEATLNPDVLTTLVQALKEEQEALKKEREKASKLELLIEEQQSQVAFAQYLQDSFTALQLLFQNCTYFFRKELYVSIS